MFVRTWREAFMEALRSSGESLDDVVWKNTREDWLDSRWVPEWNELVMTEKYTYAVFYNKLSFISKRYVALNEEMRRRGYSPNQIPLEILEEGIDRRMFHDYNPTLAALEISRQRIKEKFGE